MVILMDRWIRRIARMNGLIGYNKTELPFLTCDNPAVTWKKMGAGFQIGVIQSDPDLVVSCPLAPDLILVAYQTQESLDAVLAENHYADRPPSTFRTHINAVPVPDLEVTRLNHICVGNAHRYVYSSYKSDALLQFLADTFVGKSAPGPPQG
jgi:hypothetical protein